MSKSECQTGGAAGMVEGAREMTAVERKLNLSFGLFAMAFKIKRHQLAQKHPELGPRELDARTHQCFKDC